MRKEKQSEQVRNTRRLESIRERQVSIVIRQASKGPSPAEEHRGRDKLGQPKNVC
jgi:hypothetical protein